MKPILRGHLHQAAFFFAVVAGAYLISTAEEGLSRWAALVYVVSLAGLFGISGVYHGFHWSLGVRRWLRRLDHSAIFILIAGSATPVCLIGLGNDLGVRLVIYFWIAALAGIIKELFWIHSPRIVTVVVYIAVGAAAVPFIPDLASSLGLTRVTLIVTGGVLYAAGAVVYALRRPDPIPHIFGYHEVFHALVVVASALHFVVVYQLVRSY